MSELITELPADFMREFEADLLARIPEEKAQCELRQARNARIMQQAGSVCIEGIGQKVAEIDARLYFRMLHEAGGPGNTDWLDDFLADNPQLCAPGWKPRRRPGAIRHVKSFVGGKPI
jgi:hypothetical protein